MKNKRQLSYFIVFATMLGLFAFQNCAKTQFVKEVASIDPGVVGASVNALDFGNVLINTSSLKSFSLSNSTNSAVTIDQVFFESNPGVYTYSSSCASVGGAIPIASQSQCEFVITFRPVAVQSYLSLLKFKISNGAIVSLNLSGNGKASTTTTISTTTTTVATTTTIPATTTTIATSTTLPPPVNGSCGSSAYQSFTSTPTNNLCSSGIPNAVNLNTGNNRYTWQCSGTFGGSNASCFAYYKADAQCVQGSPSPYNPGEISNSCNPGTPSNGYISGNDWIWTCLGINGGANASCRTPVSHCYYKPQKHICCYTMEEYTRFYDCLSIEAIVVRMNACSTQAQLDQYKIANPGVCP